ncbi:MAG: pilus assembly protein [Anaerolineae bacterium]|nr:pilus assembly protein [Anaerolineae bacterium]MDW8172404.1 pilus assembly protein [Anaerolineae bacterium]
MDKLLKAVLRILDGAPRRDKQGQHGQSLIELAFITPLLIIMVVGIVEIGWYANHYLILLEVTRVGARAGAVAPPDLVPLMWTEQATIHPVVYRDVLNNADVRALLARPALDVPPETQLFRRCDSGRRGFYNYIICTMLNSMDPLTLRGRRADTTDDVGKVIYDRFGQIQNVIPFPDDIVVSVFSVQVVNNANPSSVTFPTPPARGSPNYAQRYGEYKVRYEQQARIFNITRDFDAAGAPTAGRYPRGFSAIVVGRYPESANECNFYRTSSGNWATDTSGDPFDYINNGNLDRRADGVRIELAAADTPPEAQRGFVWTGQWRVQEPDPNPARTRVCYGSEWSSDDVERLLNLPNFLWRNVPSQPRPSDYPGGASDPNYIAALNAYNSAWAVANERAQFLPNQGILLVEMHWMHDLLLNFPFMSTILNFFGDINNVRISVWAAFPLPSMEPNIQYRLAAPPAAP